MNFSKPILLSVLLSTSAWAGVGLDDSTYFATVTGAELQAASRGGVVLARQRRKDQAQEYRVVCTDRGAVNQEDCETYRFSKILSDRDSFVVIFGRDTYSKADLSSAKAFLSVLRAKNLHLDLQTGGRRIVESADEYLMLLPLLWEFYPPITPVYALAGVGVTLGQTVSAPFRSISVHRKMKRYLRSVVSSDPSVRVKLSESDFSEFDSAYGRGEI